MRSRILMTPVALLATSLAWADVTDEQTFNYEIDSNGRISLENINGDVTITGGTGNSVEIVAFKKADNQEYLDGIEIKINASGDMIRIETEHPDSDGGWFSWGDGGGSVTYTLSVPASVNLDTIESVNGDVEISGVFGVVKAETVNGTIDAEDLSDNAKLETVNGAIRATFVALSGEQRVEAETVNGKVSLTLPSNADAAITADTVNGGIDGEDFGLITNKGFVGRDLEGQVGDGSARVELSTVNGAIKIRKG